MGIAAILFCFLLALPGAMHAQVNVLTQHNDLARTGANLAETQLRPDNVSTASFGMLFKHQVDDQLYGQPLIVTGVKAGGARRDLVFVTTVNNSVYAFDANDATATQPIWHVNFGMPANLHDANFGCLDMNGNMGIVGTPVIDAQKGTLYVVALTHAGNSFMQRLHALDLATGADLPASPVTIQAPGFDPLMQNQRPALALGNGNVYIGYASHCDKEPYHGYLFAYNAATLAQTGVLNTSPGGEGASIWQSGQGPAIDAQGNVYVVTGNGSWNGKTQLSESFLRLSPELKVLDWFTPTNHEELDKKDDDLNSSGATLVPGPGAGKVIGGGKEGVLYVLDPHDLGHLGDEHAIEHFKATKSHLHSLAYWDSAKKGELIYVWGQRDQARVYQLRQGKVTETPVMTRPEANEGHPGAMLSLSANGNHDGILWAAIHATGDSWHESRPGILHAYDADDINRELWNSLQNPVRDDCGNYSKMAPPTIANGKVYLASFGKDNTGTGQFCVYGLVSSSSSLLAPQGLASRQDGRSLHLHWAAVPGAETYTIKKQREHDAPMIVSGITGLSYTDAAPDASAVYLVRAVDHKGPGAYSMPLKAAMEDTPVARMDH